MTRPTVCRARDVRSLPYLLLGLGAGAFQCARLVTSSRYARAEFFVDDAYYYFKIAQNMAAGKGSTWDGIHATNGYHPLWLLLLIPVFFVARGKVAGMVGAKLAAAALWLLALLEVRRIARLVGAEGTFWIGTLPVVAYAVAYSRSMPFAGVETGLLIVLTLVAVRMMLESRLLGDRDPAMGHRSVWIVGIVLAAMVTSRLDAGFLAAAFVLAVAIRMLVRRRPLGEIAHTSVALAGPIALALALYLGVNQLVFGSALPVSGRVKQIGHPLHGWQALRGFFGYRLLPGVSMGMADLAIVVGIAVVLVATSRASRRLPEAAPALPGFARAALVQLGVLTAIIYVTGIVTIGYYDRTSPWKLFSWYYYQGFLVLLLGPPVIVVAIVEWWRQRSGRSEPSPRAARSWSTRACAVAAAGVAAIGVVGGVVTRVHRDGNENFFTQNARAADVLNHRLRRSAVVAMGDRAGAFGYFLDRPVVSLEGVVNSTAYLGVLRHRTVHQYLHHAHVDVYARSSYLPTEPRHGLGAWGISGPRDRCGLRSEPAFGNGPKVLFVVCPGGLLYASPPGHADRFAAWRWP